MYIECKAGNLTGQARIGRVTFSQTGRTIYYRGRKFQSLKGKEFKSNYYDLDTGEDYWISGPKRGGGDALWQHTDRDRRGRSRRVLAGYQAPAKENK
jgi:hypothetical protein